ncbi:hypothetical protein AB0G04_36235 [Actinoplanes sp. NPDC023801]|uniref:hypothetical protein n=1 Tax=Actinoplanes sp. NPDC023801 TaxID=3154595 RepID=UPI0033E70397
MAGHDLVAAKDTILSLNNGRCGWPGAVVACGARLRTASGPRAVAGAAGRVGTP